MPNHRITIPALIILIIIPAAYAGLTIFGKDILYLKTEPPIEAEKAWKIDNTVFYITDGEMEMIESAQLERIVSGGYGIMNMPGLLAYHFIHKQQNLIRLLGWMAMAAIIYALFLAAGRAKKRGKNKTALMEASESAASDLPIDDGLKFNFGLNVVKFFLGIFKYQLEAPAAAPSRIASGERDAARGTYTYLLHVKHHGNWHSRRMSISAIGEAASSRSQCYYAIYDTHMVIKIPPKPVTDFNKYLENIRREKQIADKIAPRECLVPRVSTILSRVHKFANQSRQNPEQLEQNYITLADTREELKRLLKIGDTHAYFMDLSKYYFLGPIIKDMHDHKAAAYREIMGNPHILWDAHEFDGRYGTDAHTIRHDLMTGYAAFKGRLKTLQNEHGIDAERIRHRRRDWFLKALAGTPPNQMAEDFPEAFRSQLSGLIHTLIKENQSVIQAHTDLIHAYVTRVAQARNQPVMAAMITNLLDLLAWLGSKGVAIRDLKPDNLLAAGDPNKFPIFLSTAAEYNIGLIDMETAVDYNPGAMREVAQPLLGGTLFYATPTHYLSNRLLEKYFRHPNRILYLQDWYAALAIIYEIICGDYLFKQSARLLHTKIKTIKQTDSAAEAMTSLFKQARLEFWQKADAEVQAGLKTHTDHLQAVTPELPEEFRDWLKEELQTTRNDLKLLAFEKIQAYPGFNAAKKQQLRDFSIPQIEKLRQNRADETVTPDLSAKKRAHLVGFLSELIDIRRGETGAGDFLNMASNESRPLTAFDLIEMMFLVVRHGMRTQ